MFHTNMLVYFLISLFLKDVSDSSKSRVSNKVTESFFSTIKHKRFDLVFYGKLFVKKKFGTYLLSKEEFNSVLSTFCWMYACWFGFCACGGILSLFVSRKKISFQH